MEAAAHHVLHAIRSRRVVRHFTAEPVTRDDVQQLLEAARWAPAGGNRRVHRYVAILDPLTIHLVRAVSPGISGRPTGLIVVCIDWERVSQLGGNRRQPSLYIDIGTATENMLLAAHALGLGAGPVTSFGTGAVSAVLGLPEWLAPHLIVCLGHAAERQSFHQSRPPKPTRLADLVYWERFSGDRATRE